MGEPRRPKRPALFFALAGLATALAVGGVGAAWWAGDLRWRPRILDHDGAAIAQAFETAGWVSPRGIAPHPGRILYMLSFRACGDCIRFEREEFPKLQAAGVDTRVVVIAKRAVSTRAERSGVAELWARRDWATYKAWTDMPVAAFTAEGLPDADATPERAALVEKGRALVDTLRPLLAENGVALRYPTLVWRDADGRWRGCACEQRQTYRFVRRELGLPG